MYRMKVDAHTCGYYQTDAFHQIVNTWQNFFTSFLKYFKSMFDECGIYKDTKIDHIYH